MNISVTAEQGGPVVNELGPVIVFTICFLITMGGIGAYAYVLCHGRVNLTSLDFWKGVGKIQCK